MQAQKPVAKFRAGQVTCALWENEITVSGKPQKVLKATIDRRFKDRDGNWKSSNSYGRNELPLAIWVLYKAFETMIEKAGDEDRSEPVSEEHVV